MASVVLKNVKKNYNNHFTAIKDANLEIADKEFMVIVGSSGCGKTTILRMIAGLEDITEGTIAIGQQIVNDIQPKDRDIAMVFQNYALYPHMTVFENMAFGLKMKKYPKAQVKEKVVAIAKMLGIEDLMNRKPKQLSGGQRQRVALGRAIVRKPKAFLFDEPLSSLDTKLRLTTRAELKMIHRKLQTTSIYVTHDQAEAMVLGDRICVMHEGVIQQIASPMEVFNKPVNRFVGGFFGTPPMNFFDGKIEIEEGRVAFVLSNGPSIKLVDMHTKLSSYAGRPMVLGVRPEHFSFRQLSEQKTNAIPATVAIIEPLGHKKEIYLTAGNGQRFIVNSDLHVDIAVGQHVELFVDTEKVAIFEPGDLGINVSLRGKY